MYAIYSNQQEEKGKSRDRMRKRAELLAQSQRERRRRIEAISRAAAKRFSCPQQSQQHKIISSQINGETDLEAEMDKVEGVLGLAGDKQAEWAKFFHGYFLELAGFVRRGEWDEHKCSFERSRSEILRLHTSAREVKQEAERRNSGNGLEALRLRAQQLVMLLAVYGDALEEFSAARSSSFFTEYVRKIGEENCVWHCM